jgi:DNA polymerase
MGGSYLHWSKVLENAGWPTTVVVLDFETFFSDSYHMKGKGTSGLSTIEYIMDPRFEEIGVGCLVMDQPYKPRQTMFWPKAQEHIAWLQSRYGKNLDGCTLVAQNCRFDFTILVRKHDIVPKYVVDILALSRHQDARNTHGLAAQCERWGLPPKGDTLQFKGLHWADMTPEQKQAMSDYCCNDVDREMDLFEILLPRLTRPEVELRLQAHTLRLFWQPDLAFDAVEADRLIVAMEAQVAKDVPIPLTPKLVSGNKSFVRLLGTALAQTGEVVPMKEGKKGMIAALAKDDGALKDLRIHKNPRVRELIKARQAVKSWPLHIRRITSMSQQAKAAGGWLPNPLNYYGAHTGRWSGGEGINTCNLPTRGTGLQTEMKHCLVAPEGSVLIMADAAQIEARGTAWIAGQDDLVEAFRQDGDVYSDFAQSILCVPVRKGRKTDPGPVAKMYNTRRAIGKTGILGCGYGMGAARALEYMMTYPELEPQIEEGIIDLLFAKRLVDGYRAKYRMIPKFWNDLEATFVYVTRYGQSRMLQGLSLSRTGTTTVVTLPSGRSLFYHGAAVDKGGKISYQAGPVREKLWGGTLTENVVQAMSRDVLAEALLYVEDHGFRVAHHVYDSLVVVTPESQDTLAFACVSEALTRVPTWSEGWPMGVETTIGRRYD